MKNNKIQISKYSKKNLITFSQVIATCEARFSVPGSSDTLYAQYFLPRTDKIFSPCSTSIKIPDQIKHQWLWTTWSSKRCSCPQQNKMVFKSPFQPNTYYDSMPWRINAHWLKDDGRRGLIVVGTGGQGCATGCPADSGKHYKPQLATVFLSHF